MQAGKVASLGLLAAFMAVVAVVHALAIFTNVLPDGSPIARFLLLLGVTGAAFVLVLVPLGYSFDKTVARLRHSIEHSVDQSKAPLPFDAPRWLRPMTNTFTAALEHFQQREQSLRQQLGEQEIRCRVAESEHRQVRTAIDTLADGVIVTDAFNEIVLVNHAAAKYLGFDMQEAVHKPIDKVVVDQALCRIIADARDSGNFKDVRHVEQQVRYGDTDEESRFYEISLMSVENQKGDVGGVVTILHDLTREKEIAQRETDFVSKASHELRTPLTSIRAYVEMLVDKEAEDEESRQEFYRIIQN